jgi:RAB protein geranylgeranyltransferase component A
MNPQEIINENIIAALGIQALPLEKKQEVLNKLVELVQKRIMLRVMDGLSKEDGEKMAELEKNPMEMLAFIAEKFPNFEEIVKEEVEKVKEEALSAAEQVG